MPKRTLTTASSGVLRDGHLVKANDGEWYRTTLLEGSRTNSLLDSGAFGSTEWAGTASVSTGVDTGPDGTTGSAAQVTDGSTSATQGIRQDVTVPDDSDDRTASFFLSRSSTAPGCTLVLDYRGSTSASGRKVYRLHIDPDSGSGVTSIVGGSTVSTSVTNSGVDEWDDDWWRAWLAGPNTNEGHTTARWRLFPASGTTTIDSSLTGTQTIFGAQLEGV